MMRTCSFLSWRGIAYVQQSGQNNESDNVSGRDVC